MDGLKKDVVKVNRNGIKQYFITFPQTETPREEFVNKLFPDKHAKDRFMCVQEHHKDGNLHLHLGCILHKKVTWTRLMEIVTSVYPNDYKRIQVQQMVSWKFTKEYFEKEDKTPYLYNVSIGGIKWNCLNPEHPDYISDERIAEMDKDDSDRENYRFWCEEIRRLENMKEPNQDDYTDFDKYVFQKEYYIHEMEYYRKIFSGHHLCLDFQNR